MIYIFRSFCSWKHDEKLETYAIMYVKYGIFKSMISHLSFLWNHHLKLTKIVKQPVKYSIYITLSLFICIKVGYWG